MNKLTDINSKLAESKYFLNQMIASGGNRVEFQNNLSAFLTASRSVLQYIHGCIKQFPEQKHWYDASISQATIVHFLKDERDKNIHVKPLHPSANINLDLAQSMTITQTMFGQLDRKDGTSQVFGSRSSAVTLCASDGEETLETTFWFQNWNGPEDVLTLAKYYLNEVGEIVREGTEKGYL